MGQVYRARDTRLNRVVAIKVLLPDIDPGFEQSRRFEREAQAIAALNHPHICAVHDVGNENGTPYLVMEYLEGETLAARLSRGPLPLSQALRCAAEISDALDKAHLAGVVHRDVKPSNIVFTPGGAKLLDFGIAKRMAVAGIESSDTFTTSSHLTQHGAVVGTLQYMAPEQVRGEEADARTDIFAFGAVLYEMVSGVKAFKAQTPTDLMVAILEHEPPRMTTLQRHVPAALERIVRVCLEKDPSDRWQSARDVTLQLRDVAAAPVIPEARAVSTRPWWILPALGLVGLVLLTAAASIYRPRPAEPPDLEFTIAPPQNSLSRMQLDPFTTVSPDGRQVAYTVRTENRPTQLWVQSLNSPDPRMLPGTDGGYIPFWSPDSTQVGFFTTDGELKAVTLADGSIRLLCKVADPLGGTWNRDGTVLFSTAATSIYTDTSVPTSGLHRISQTGGTPTLVKTAYKSGTDSRRPISRTYGAREGWPRFLPDGRHFLFLDRGTMTIQIGTLESSETTSLLPSDSQAIYARGHLLFVREGTLMAQQFDVEKLELRGEAFRVAENVRFDAVLGGAVFSASDGGALAYSQGSALGSTRQTWLDGAGRPSADLPSVMLSPQGGIRLSPDDDRIAQARLLPGQLSDIWVVGLARGQGRPVTLGPAAETNPVWSPNGVHLVYASNENGVFDLYKIAASGSGAPEVVYKSAYDKFPLDWSMDGRFIAFMLTSQQDHDRQMRLLKISGFPPGPDAYQAATYNEATATPYPTLPDPLVMNDGMKVTTPAQWKKRRAEIKEFFDREVYGRVPANMPTVKWEIVSSEKGLPMGGGLFGAPPQQISDIPVITKLLVGHVDNSSYPAITVNIGMTVVTPADATGPVPIVMQFGGGGPNPMPPNNTPNPCPPPPNFAARGAGAGRAGGAGAGAAPAARGPAGPNWQAQLLQKGWGYAMLNTSSIQADSGCGLTVGIIGLMKYGGRWDTLPVDSHELIAMVAPRPLFLSAGSGPLTNPDGTYQLMTADDSRCQTNRGPCATQPVNIMDAWVDAKGTFMAGAGADPVYRLLGKKGLGTTEFPKMETGLMDGDLTYRQHAGPHTDAPNWPVFIEFADREFKAKK